MDQDDRKHQIETAAYAVLKEKGYKGASMLAIAKAAKASNETMYKWYGDKQGLFAAMIARNTQLVEQELNKSRHSDGRGLGALESVAATLLVMVTSENAVALNRAAAGDMTSVLGQTLAREGRDRVVPILSGLLADTFGPRGSAPESVETFVALLIGDLQIRRVIGVQGPLTRVAADQRATRAVRHLQAILSLESDPN